MNNSYSIKLIEALSNANGVSGFEDEAVSIIREHCRDIGDISEDAMRNLYVRNRNNNGNRPVLQLDAHTDEVGFIVHAIKPNGTLRFMLLGSWVTYCIPAHRVRVKTKNNGYVTGVIASQSPHFLAGGDKNTVPNIENMVIDVGATSRKEVLEDIGIYIGAPIIPDVEFDYDEARGLLFGKAFDCRVGCAAMTETLKHLADKKLDVNIIGAFSSQEEVGCRGAQVTASTVKPDVAIVFEGCPADDSFNDEYMIQAGIKRGPMLRHIDLRMITNPRFQRFALDIAKELGIPVQEGVRTGGATNGSAIHVHSPAVPVIVIGFPVRYIHTHHGITALSDYENGVKLACSVIERLNAEVIKKF